MVDQAGTELVTDRMSTRGGSKGVVSQFDSVPLCGVEVRMLRVNDEPNRRFRDASELGALAIRSCGRYRRGQVRAPVKRFDEPRLLRCLQNSGNCKMKSGKSVIHSEAVESPRGKVLLVIGDAAEVIDTVYPLMRLQEAGYQVVVAGPEDRIYCLVQHQRPEGWDITRETAGYEILADIAFRDIDPAEYAGILISGGRAPEYIRYDEQLLDAVRWLFEAGRPVGSVCHGIEVLATAGVIRGKRITTVPKCRFDAEVCGATYVESPVVVDGILVTACGALDGWRWLREFLPLLEQRR